MKVKNISEFTPYTLEISIDNEDDEKTIFNAGVVLQAYALTSEDLVSRLGQLLVKNTRRDYYES